MAQRFTDAFDPRLQSSGRREEARGGLPREELEASAEETVRALDGRMERALERFAREVSRLEGQPQLQTAALEKTISGVGRVCR
jgi:hypothetical protein